MPFKTAAQRRAWDRAYTRKRTEEGRQERVTCEQEVLKLVTARPGTFDPPTLFYALDQRYSFSAIQKAVEDLCGNRCKGLIEYKRDGRGRKLWPCEIHRVTIELTPTPTMTEDRS